MCRGLAVSFRSLFPMAMKSGRACGDTKMRPVDARAKPVPSIHLTFMLEYLGISSIFLFRSFFALMRRFSLRPAGQTELCGKEPGE